jgi:hypothetical protein
MTNKLSPAHKEELAEIVASARKARTPEVDEGFDLCFRRPVQGFDFPDVLVYYSRNPIFVSRKLETAPKVERSYERDRHYEGITLTESTTLKALAAVSQAYFLSTRRKSGS